MGTNHKAPIPKNEMDRIMKLSEMDLDYTDLSEKFKDLTLLAAKVSGADISLINLIDSYTQWSIADFGIDITQMPREDSVCQYVVAENAEFEVKDLSADERFADKDYVAQEPKLRYYFGVPITTKDGASLGALCVMDQEEKSLTPEKVELLKIIADEIVNRFEGMEIVKELKEQLEASSETTKKVSHDIRGPISGIIGVADIIKEKINTNQLDDIIMLMDLIEQGGRSILELADTILSSDKASVSKAELKSNQFNLEVFKEKLENLYTPQAVSKGVKFEVTVTENNQFIPFPKNKLVQIVGNLISNAIKFTPEDGLVTTELDLVLEPQKKDILKIKVRDNGHGMSLDVISTIMDGDASSTDGTGGEEGYGFGLALVQHLIESLNGQLNIQSVPGQGSLFEVSIPFERKK